MYDFTQLLVISVITSYSIHYTKLYEIARVIEVRVGTVERARDAIAHRNIDVVIGRDKVV